MRRSASSAYFESPVASARPRKLQTANPSVHRYRRGGLFDVSPVRSVPQRLCEPPKALGLGIHLTAELREKYRFVPGSGRLFGV